MIGVLAPHQHCALLGVLAPHNATLCYMFDFPELRDLSHNYLSNTSAFKMRTFKGNYYKLHNTSYDQLVGVSPSHIFIVSLVAIFSSKSVPLPTISRKVPPVQSWQGGTSTK
jgi:hypothetical protein